MSSLSGAWKKIDELSRHLPRLFQASGPATGEGREQPLRLRGDLSKSWADSWRATHDVEFDPGADQCGKCRSIGNWCYGCCAGPAWRWHFGSTATWSAATQTEVSPAQSDWVSRVSMGSVRNACEHSPLKSQTADMRDGHDEPSKLAWRCRLFVPIRADRPGIGAARDYQPGQMRPVLPERKLPELRAGKSLYELWRPASLSLIWL